jgi:hypothetical protein
MLQAVQNSQVFPFDSSRMTNSSNVSSIPMCYLQIRTFSAVHHGPGNTRSA